MSAIHPTNAIIDFNQPWYHYLSYFAELDAKHSQATHGHAPAINAINIIISFFIAYEIYIVNLILPVFFQTPTLQHFLLFLHFVLHVFLILHYRIKQLFSIFL